MTEVIRNLEGAMTLERIGLILIVWMLLNALCAVLLARPIDWNKED